MFNFLKKRASTLFFVLFACAFCAVRAYAGTGGTEFDNLWDTTVAWTQGGFGRSMGLIAVVAGILMFMFGGKYEVIVKPIGAMIFLGGSAVTVVGAIFTALI
jgi:conjugal transfer pilus assembly protein TraA